MSLQRLHRGRLVHSFDERADQHRRGRSHVTGQRACDEAIGDAVHRRSVFGHAEVRADAGCIRGRGLPRRQGASCNSAASRVGDVGRGLARCSLSTHQSVIRLASAHTHGLAGLSDRRMNPAKSNRSLAVVVETTGSSPDGGDRVVEIAATEYVDGVVNGRCWHVYFNPGRPMSRESTMLTGLTDEFLADKPTFAQCIDEFRTFLAGATLVLYGAERTVAFLNAEFSRCNLSVADSVHTVIDLLLQSTELQPDADNRLEAVCRRYFVDTAQRNFFGEALRQSDMIARLAIRLSSGRIGRAVAQQDQSSRVHLTSFEHFIAETKELSRTCLCRGVPDKDFLLLPSLFRTFNDKHPDTLERNLMWMFRNHASGILDRLPASELEWLTVAQHHGLPTRLLDWSLSPLAAAFFAAESLSPSDGAVFLLELGAFRQAHQIDLSKLDEIVAFFPVHAARRMAAQSCAFTVHPTAVTTLSPNCLKRLVVPAALKATFKERLFKLGVHRGTMFPDLDGLASELRYLNDFD